MVASGWNLRLVHEIVLLALLAIVAGADVATTMLAQISRGLRATRAHATTGFAREGVEARDLKAAESVEEAMALGKPQKNASALLDKVLFFEDALVDCKGQVWQADTQLLGVFKDDGMPAEMLRRYSLLKKKSLVGPGSRVHFRGCPYGRGSCLNPAWVNLTLGPAPGAPGGPLDTIVVLTQPQWGAYFHFVIDGLSRLVHIREHYPHLIDRKDTFFHTGYSDELGQQWARLVGIRTAAGRPGGGSSNRLLEGTWKARTVVYPPSNPCSSGQLEGASAYVMRGMRALIERTLPGSGIVDAPSGAYALLIERNPSGARGVLNHEAVRTALEEELGRSSTAHPSGWKVVVHSYRSLADMSTQCTLFRNAKMIIGPHGAGFVNLICARKGTPVIEFQQELHAHDYEILAAKLELPYIGVPTSIAHDGHGNVSVSSVLAGVRQAAQAKPAGWALALDHTVQGTPTVA